MEKIALIIAGGIGSRLWPISTKTKSKQFINLYIIIPNSSFTSVYIPSKLLSPDLGWPPVNAHSPSLILLLF